MVRFKPTWLQSIAPILVGVPVSVMFLTGLFFLGGLLRPFDETIVLQSCEGMAVFILISSSLSLGITVELTTDGLIIRGFVKRFIAWNDISSIEVTSGRFARYVLVRQKGIKVTRLPTPSGFLDKNFDERVDIISGRWRAHLESGGVNP